MSDTPAPDRIVVYASALGPDLALIVDRPANSLEEKIYEAYAIDSDANPVFTVGLTRFVPDGAMIEVWTRTALQRMQGWQKGSEFQWVGWPACNDAPPNCITDDQLRLWGHQAP